MVLAAVYFCTHLQFLVSTWLGAQHSQYYFHLIYFILQQICFYEYVDPERENSANASHCLKKKNVQLVLHI
jgi:hypothetical protein